MGAGSEIYSGSSGILDPGSRFCYFVQKALLIGCIKSLDGGRIIVDDGWEQDWGVIWNARDLGFADFILVIVSKYLNVYWLFRFIIYWYMCEQDQSCILDLGIGDPDYVLAFILSKEPIEYRPLNRYIGIWGRGVGRGRIRAVLWI
jgi:hypothetical protein